MFLLFVLESAISVSQQTLIYKGKIDKYPVEVQFESCDPVDGTFTGRYRYEGKKTFIDLEGEFAPPVIFMEEYYKGRATGNWYLEMKNDSINGYWISDSKSQKVQLIYSSGDRSLLKRKSEMDYSQEVNGKLTGDYEVNHYFLNEMGVSEENLRPELGYNGGQLTISEREDGNLDFDVQVVCGPTYHLAFAQGIAVKNGQEFIYKSEEGCVITFLFTNKQVHVESNGNFECGFGARAYLNHDFFKVSDVPSALNEE